jgi:hypothetical protein
MSDLAERVASLEMALRNVGQVLVAKRGQWCGAIDCHCVLARLALRHGRVPRRPDPTPDKINEAFRRATRC